MANSNNSSAARNAPVVEFMISWGILSISTLLRLPFLRKKGLQWREACNSLSLTWYTFNCVLFQKQDGDMVGFPNAARKAVQAYSIL